MDRMLIEEKSIEHLKLFAEISEEARAEKPGRPPINELLYWWTRKPLIVSRAITLLSTIPSTVSLDHAKSMLFLKNEKRSYNYSPSPETYRKLQGNDVSSLKVFDPFAGSGNLLFEASRLGLECFLMDYNPVAYLIMKATLQYPAIYGEKLASDVERYGKEVIERAKKELEKFYKREGANVLHYLWSWCVRCPHCGQRVPLTNQMWLDKKSKIGYRIKPTRDKNFTVEIGKLGEKEGSRYTQKGGKAECINCGNVINYEDMTRDIAERRDKEMIAVVVKSQKGKNYEVANEEDRQTFNSAREELKNKWNWLLENDLIPTEEIKKSELSNVTNYGLLKWYEFFNERQLLLMATLLKIMREVLLEINDREYSKVIAIYLGFLLCKHVNFNCIGILWDTSNEKISHALAFRSPSIIYNFAETNPFEKTSGSLYTMLDDIVNAVRFASINKRPANIFLGSACRENDYPEGKFSLVITDPPYLDDVAYAGASEFFYVWLVRLLRAFYPELPRSVPNDEDLVYSRGRFGGDGKLALEFYKKGMKLAFQNIYNILDDNGLLVVFFAHSSTDAWNLLLEVLRGVGFRVVSSFAVHTESITNVLARGKTSFMSSIVLACRKILEDKEAYFESLMPRIEERISKFIKELSEEELLSIPITDLLIMTYGMVLEELTQYARIKSYRAGFEAKFEDLIGEARDFMLKEIVKRLTGRSPQTLGPDASFCLIAKIFYRGIISSDEALKVVRAYGVTVDALEKRGYVERRKEGGVRVKSFTEVALNLSPEEVGRDSIYQQLLYLLKTIHGKGAAAVKPLLSHPNFRAQEIQYLVALLIKHYRLLINRKEKLTDEERTELNALEALSDVIGLRSPEKNTLDSYM